MPTVSTETIIARSVWLLSLFRFYFSSLLHPLNTPTKLQLKTLIIFFSEFPFIFLFCFVFLGAFPQWKLHLTPLFASGSKSWGCRIKKDEKYLKGPSTECFKNRRAFILIWINQDFLSCHVGSRYSKRFSFLSRMV